MQMLRGARPRPSQERRSTMPARQCPLFITHSLLSLPSPSSAGTAAARTSTCRLPFQASSFPPWCRIPRSMQRPPWQPPSGRPQMLKLRRVLLQRASWGGSPWGRWTLLRAWPQSPPLQSRRRRRGGRRTGSCHFALLRLLSTAASHSLRRRQAPFPEPRPPMLQKTTPRGKKRPHTVNHGRARGLLTSEPLLQASNHLPCRRRIPMRAGKPEAPAPRRWKPLQWS